MYAFKYNVELPTTTRLDTDIPEGTDAGAIAREVLDRYTAAVQGKDANAYAALFLEDGVWRDKVAFTWNYRTFNGQKKIHKAAVDLLPRVHIATVALIDPAPCIARPYPDLPFVQAHFTFETDQIRASAVVNIVMTKYGPKIWTLHTAIEGLIGFPELPNRDGHMTGPVSWAEQRVLDANFDTHQPDVLIIGGGHNGLMTAARFKALGVTCLVVEKNERIGDNWRKRYEALSLHFPHWPDHFPYMPYPEHWPVFCPAGKLGDWLEWYVSAMELNVWTGSSVEKCKQSTDGTWRLEVKRDGKEKRVLTPKHLIMATSLAGVPMVPSFPGDKEFKGVILHSTQHTSSRGWEGKKVLVVGTSSSGFDTAYDFARRGIDVTMLQRSRTYIMSLSNSIPKASKLMVGFYEPKSGKKIDLEACDRIAYSMPVGPAEELGRRMVADIAREDKELIDAMEGAGFKTWLGQRSTGNQTLSYSKNGGFYFDAGACEHIINGNIKVEQGTIERFTPNSVILSGGREKLYDLVVLATGFSNTIDSVRATLGHDIADRCKPIWGIDEEGELNSTWKDCGVPNLWIMVGTLQHGRYHSKKVSLRIKAMMEGIAGEPYTD
ncbi:putative flavin-containing monooxygenase [Naematelia encephala]|uniref:Putative flavin-containing monooxygenase n=1 Tax=Naematelia encephala TaxID=71784 RepID=A0A1Y2AWW2_9TREE|nr:putative flavin-containing monooxygenase [Naematelia encephala]